MRLQKQVRAMVRKYGPKMGALYYDETSNWEKQVCICVYICVYLEVILMLN